MDDLTNRLQKLGAAVAEVSDRTADPATLPNARRRFLSSSDIAEPRRSLGPLLGGYRVPLIAFAGLACAALIALFLWRRDPALSFSVGGSHEPGSVGQWVAPEAEAPLDVRFSEGTVVTLTPGARMRVTDTSTTGATLLIERGAIHAAITHRDSDTRWSVRAGPFEVRVTGTAFDARWDPATETFDLSMLEGSVIVSGPRLPSGRVVVAGEQLVVSTTKMELRAGAAPTAAKSDPVADAPLAPSAPSPAPCVSPDTPSPVASAASSSRAADAPRADGSWKALAQAGKYKEAIAAAEAAGFAGEMSRASSTELRTLADVARFGGRPALAKTALLSLRKRFGARGGSAFLLGKISADQLRSPGEAAMWFDTYLQEEPGGPLAEQALGRLMEIRKRDTGAARLLAERYLARYPNGAYAALARSLVGR
ncbi:MAG: FecR domain-containing protein [Polyangiaceae bacterium]